jgi:hypothetical protein
MDFCTITVRHGALLPIIGAQFHSTRETAWCNAANYPNSGCRTPDPMASGAQLTFQVHDRKNKSPDRTKGAHRTIAVRTPLLAGGVARIRHEFQG